MLLNSYLIKLNSYLIERKIEDMGGIKKITVHAGHNPDGKIACGAVGLIKESTEARKVVKYICKYLKTAKITPLNITVNEGISQSDIINTLVKRANKYICPLNISIHFNSGAGDRKGNKKTTGVEVLIHPKANEHTIQLAQDVLYEVSKLGFTNRGVKKRTDLGILNTFITPTILIECCFVDDKDDVKIYKAKKMAQAITTAILNVWGLENFKNTKSIRTFTTSGKVIRKIPKNRTCKIDRYMFHRGFLMGHRKKCDEWVKMKYLKNI